MYFGFFILTIKELYILIFGTAKAELMAVQT